MIRVETISERRDEARMEIDRIAIGELEGNFFTTPFEGKTLNIGPTGMLFESDMLLEPGTEVKVTTEVAGKPIDFTGTVVRVVSNYDGTVKLGIQFSDLNKKAEQLISKEIGQFLARFTPHLN